jgi:hypothetical protein
VAQAHIKFQARMMLPVNSMLNCWPVPQIKMAFSHQKWVKKTSKYFIIFLKAIGEPPLFLGSAAFFAIREAIGAYRRENGCEGYFRLDSPATPERIRMACEDAITKNVGHNFIQIISCIFLQATSQSSPQPWTVEL